MALPTKVTFYKKNSHRPKVTGLRDGETLVLITTDTVTATLFTKNADGTTTPVAGATNMTLTAVTGQDGSYRGQIDKNAFDPPKGGNYVFVIDSTDGHWEIPAEVKVRVNG